MHKCFDEPLRFRIYNLHLTGAAQKEVLAVRRIQIKGDTL